MLEKRRDTVGGNGYVSSPQVSGGSVQASEGPKVCVVNGIAVNASNACYAGGA